MHGLTTITGELYFTGTGTGKTEIAFECAKRRSIYPPFSGIDSIKDNNNNKNKKL